MEVTFQRVRFELSAKAFLPALDLFQAPRCHLVEKKERREVTIYPEEMQGISLGF
jgi:hypothetical protein